MRIVVQSFEQVLNKQISKLVLSFAQYIFNHAPTKSDYFFNSIFGVLDSFEAVKLFTFLFISQIFTPLFFAVKSLEANLVIKSSVVMS